MNNERDRALGQFVALKKQIYELGVKAQSLVKDIHDETNLFYEKDFASMDFQKVEALAKELLLLQPEFEEKVEKAALLKSTYNF